MKREITLGNEFYTVTAHRHGDNYTASINDVLALTTRLEHVEGEDYNVIVNGVSTPIKLISHGEKTFIKAFGRNFELDVIDPVDRASEQSGSTSVVKAPMPGIIIEVNVTAGQQVTKGEPLLSIESMKIMTVIKAWRDGEIEAINFAAGDAFDKSAVLVAMIEEDEEDGEQK
jgi:acetyl/propionyl-CoA carboxylase alpha subunit